MTTTEALVIGGGLLLGYWIVSVFVPSLFERSSDQAEESAATGSDTADDARSHYENRGGETDDSRSAGGDGRSPRWFEVLEVAESASREQIVAAYKLQISQYHPDKVAQMGPDIRRLAEAKSKAINAAYDEALRS